MADEWKDFIIQNKFYLIVYFLLHLPLLLILISMFISIDKVILAIAIFICYEIFITLLFFIMATMRYNLEQRILNKKCKCEREE